MAFLFLRIVRLSADVSIQSTHRHCRRNVPQNRTTGFVDSGNNVSTLGQGTVSEYCWRFFVGAVDPWRHSAHWQSSRPAGAIHGGTFMAVCALVILITHADQIPEAFKLIFRDAFTGQAVTGGSTWCGHLHRCAARSILERGPAWAQKPWRMAQLKPRKPIREGLVAMLGPMIDTLIVCTITGLVIINTGVWKKGGHGGSHFETKGWYCSILQRKPVLLPVSTKRLGPVDNRQTMTPTIRNRILKHYTSRMPWGHPIEYGVSGETDRNGFLLVFGRTRQDTRHAG